MRRWTNITFITTALLYSSLAFAQKEPAAIAELDTNAILVGEQVTLKLTLRAPAQDLVTWPQWKETLAEHVEIIEAKKIDTAFDHDDIGTRVLTQELILTSFDSGYFAIPPVMFGINGEPLESNPFLLSVSFVPLESSDEIRDIKSPFDVDFSLLDWLKLFWPWVVGTGGVLAAIGLLIFLLTRKKQTIQQTVMRKPVVPAHVTALKKLEDLRKRKLWQSGHVKQYHSELTEIVREYIEKRFKVPALEQTTDEIIGHLKKSDLNEAATEKLGEMLMLSDLVKFAKGQPLPNENELSMKLAVEFVEMTRPRPQPANANQKAAS